MWSIYPNLPIKNKQTTPSSRNEDMTLLLDLGTVTIFFFKPEFIVSNFCFWDDWIGVKKILLTHIIVDLSYQLVWFFSTAISIIYGVVLQHICSKNMCKGNLIISNF